MVTTEGRESKVTKEKEIEGERREIGGGERGREWEREREKERERKK